MDAVTAAPKATSQNGVCVHHVPSWTPRQLFQFVQNLRLGKLLNWLVWPDEFLFWSIPAFRQALELTTRHDYDAICVFMMPYSQGLAGLALKRVTGLPLIMNLNDSITCSDMNSSYPSRLHYWLAHKLEDAYVQASDAVIYVSEENMNRVRQRQSDAHRHKFHLIRRGVAALPEPARASDKQNFNLLYTGGTSGWYKFLEREDEISRAKAAYRAFNNLGRYQVTLLDHRTHGPIIVGQAIKRVLKRRPEWQERLYIEVFGGRYPEDVEQAVLDRHGLNGIVRLHDKIPHEEVLERIQTAGLLFMALPDRPDGTPGGRISAKTYEYLMTDRPILAALPPGENRTYLADKPGVTLVEPSDIEAMSRAIEDAASMYFAGEDLQVDRSALKPELLSTSRAEAFERVLKNVIEG